MKIVKISLKASVLDPFSKLLDCFWRH